MTCKHRALQQHTTETRFARRLVAHFGLDECVLRRVLLRVDVAMSLRPNAYHNRFHSFDITQSVFVIATKMKCSSSK